MNLVKEFYELLTCPACGETLNLRSFKSNHEVVLEGVLQCPGCNLWFPIRNGIPRLFVPGPLRPDDKTFISLWHDQMVQYGIEGLDNTDTKSDGGKVQVQQTFGHKWTRQAWWGMEGESARVMEEWLLPRYGWDDSHTYTDFMKTNHLMLDAGCGLGREALRMAQSNPEALVIGLELSECVDEAARHAREQGINNVFFIQADLMNPPIKKESIDFIISEGVLHHTPDTKLALLSLVSLLSASGEIGFYIYKKKAPLREYADDYVRQLIQDLPPDEAWGMMEPLTELGRVISELNKTVTIARDVDVLGIKAGEYDLQRLIYYNMFKCYWNDRLSFEENVLVNFDWYYPRYARRHTEKEIESWLIEIGLDIIHQHVEEAGITTRAIK